ncbi:MAG TPA: 3-phosphoshikimate 1-carboxyvinyltransferase [Acidimicrobiales bacterium]|nr:3-phosphoshikimate 1-carboxyvinyltransferase [Acidimicrobiales bacterium]
MFELTGGRPLRGSLKVPGDKSISHRALLMGALAPGTSRITGLSTGQDVAHTAAAVHALGALLEGGDRITGGSGHLHPSNAPVDVGNSGTTMRLLSGICARFPWSTVLAGDASIARRPMDRVAIPLRLMGAAVEGEPGDGGMAGTFPPLTIAGGGLHGIDYRLPVASAQVKGAVLLAGLGADGETMVRESVLTRAHTEEMLTTFGADVEVSEDRLTTTVRPSELQPFEIDIPGDPSQAAFWAVAATLVPHSEVTIEPVYIGQARACFLDVLRRMGADIEVEMVSGTEARLHVRHTQLHGTDVGGSEIPGLVDEIPVLAVAAATADGVTTFRDAGELRVKESDRIATVTAELTALGAKVDPTGDGLVVTGAAPLSGGLVSSHGDHRLAMALAVAALVAEGTTRIEGWDAVATSYPGFEEDLRRLWE